MIMADRKYIDYHGDDYGVSVNNAVRMMELIEGEKLDSISIIPNMTAFDESMDLLNDRWDSLKVKPLVSVHLDIVDGFSLAGLTDPLFTCEYNDEGMSRRVFHTSWGKLLLASYIPVRRRRIREDLTREFVLQIKRVRDRLSAGANDQKAADTSDVTDSRRVGIRLDSHMHTHMIPVVFDAMMEAVDELGLTDEIAFVRVSREPISPFRKIRGTYPRVNMVKNILLNLLSYRAERKLDKRGISYGLLWGLIMSGRMDKERVELLMQDMKDYAVRKDKVLEVLCHPGIALREEGYAEYGADDRLFLYSDDRDVEYEAAKNVSR